MIRIEELNTFLNSKNIKGKWCRVPKLKVLMIIGTLSLLVTLSYLMLGWRNGMSTILEIGVYRPSSSFVTSPKNEKVTWTGITLSYSEGIHYTDINAITENQPVTQTEALPKYSANTNKSVLITSTGSPNVTSTERPGSSMGIKTPMETSTENCKVNATEKFIPSSAASDQWDIKTMESFSNDSFSNCDFKASMANATTISVKNRFHVITMLSLFCGHIWPGYENFTVAELNERDEELLKVLESNLNHPLIEKVHLFYTDEEALQVLQQQRCMNFSKILAIKITRHTHMMDFFSYSSKFLVDEPVIAMNGDIVIGEGFENIDTERMRNQKVLYSLTRHGKKSGNCSQNYCLDLPYQGSHDTHIFRLQEPLDNKILLKLDYPINLNQSENGMIGVFQKLFKFTVLNPCHLLKTHHHHCTRVHANVNATTHSIRFPPYNWAEHLIGLSKPINVLFLS